MCGTAPLALLIMIVVIFLGLRAGREVASDFLSLLLIAVRVVAFVIGFRWGWQFMDQMGHYGTVDWAYVADMSPIKWSFWCALAGLMIGGAAMGIAEQIIGSILRGNE